MSVIVNVPQFLQHFANGTAIVKVTGSTVGECLDDLIRQFPDLRPRLFSDQVKLHQYLEVYVNGQTSYPQESAKLVKDGDVLYITNIIEGG